MTCNPCSEEPDIFDACRKEASSMAKRMTQGKDKDRLARLMGIRRNTLNQKIAQGRFTATEFLALSYFCGCEVKVDMEHYQMMIDDLLD